MIGFDFDRVRVQTRNIPNGSSSFCEYGFNPDLDWSNKPFAWGEE